MIIQGSKGGGGSFRTTPDNLRSNDTLEALLGVCAGPVVGPVRGLKSITVDGTPIEDESGELNFQDFTAVVATGDPAQHPEIPELKLGGGSSPVNVGVSITNTNTGSPGPWVSRTIANTGANAIDLRFVVSQLYSQNENGIYSTTASLELEMKPTGTTNWVNPTQGTPSSTYSESGIPVSIAGGAVVHVHVPQGNFDANGNWTAPSSPYLKITGKTTSPYVHELRVAVPNEGPYAGVGWDVRVRLIEKDSVDADPNFEKRTLSWESISAVYTDQMGGTEAWRGLAWLHLIGKASDQLTGIPDIGGPWDTKIVSVPPVAVYNPATRAYTGTLWDGSYAKAFTTDPAWIINDAISDPLWGISYVAPGSYLNKWDALEASKWFSEAVSDGNGGTEPRYSLNLAVDQPKKADEFIQYLAGAVGGIAWDTGNGEWRLKVDKPETAVDIFTLDNIEGDFSYAHTDIDSRYNDITLSFRNKEFDYREDRVRVWDQAHIDKYGRKPTSMVAVGCTGRQEALRRAMLRLRTSINEWRTVTFITNRRGKMVKPLDTVLVADYGLGDHRTTGRIVEYDAPAKKITLRDPVRLELGVSYTLVYSIPNPDYAPNSENENRNKPTITTSVTITNSSGQRGDVRELYVAEALPSNLPEFTVVAISATGLPTLPKAYRVVSTEPSEDGERITISAIEIDTGKWSASDNVDAQAIEAQIPSAITPPPLPPSNGDILTPSLVATPTGTKRQLSINWERPSSMFIVGYKIGYTLNGGTLQILAERHQDTVFDMDEPVDGSYEVFIWSVDRRGRMSQPLTASIELDNLDFGLIGVSLTNDPISVIADADGNVESWAEAVGQIQLRGQNGIVTDEVTYEVLADATGGLTVTVDAAGNYAVTGMTAQQGTVTLRATWNGDIFDKALSVTKLSLARSTAIIYIYQRATAAPALPTATTIYDFTTRILTGLDNGWQSTIPAGGDPLYVSAATVSSATDTDTVAANEWSDPIILVKDGSGFNSATLILYQRTHEKVAPSVDTTGQATYHFGDGSLTGQPTGWTKSVPSNLNGGYLWAIQATALSLEMMDVLDNTEWSAPELVNQDGTSNTVVLLYKRTETSTPPMFDTAGETTYTFATGAAVGTPVGWSTTIPDHSLGDYLWALQASAIGNGDTGTISNADWSGPFLISDGGKQLLLTLMDGNNDTNALVPDAPVFTVQPNVSRTFDSGNVSVAATYTFIYNSDPAHKNNIDGFELGVYVSDNPGSYTFGTDPNNEQWSLTSTRIDRGTFSVNFVVDGAANVYYTFAVRAIRQVNLTVDSTGYIKSAIAQSNTFRPTATQTFTGNVGSVTVAELEAAVAANDTNGLVPDAPVITSSPYVVRVYDSGNIGLAANWSFTYNPDPTHKNNIDGFEVGVYRTSTSAPYTFGTLPHVEEWLTLGADGLNTKTVFTHAFVGDGSPNSYYTFGIRAVRKVNPSVDPSGWIKSPIAQTGPYRYASTHSFTGRLNNTDAGLIESWSYRAASGLNADGTVANGKTGTAAIMQGAINEAGWVRQGATIALTNETFTALTLSSISITGDRALVRLAFCWEIQKVAPIHKVTYSFKVRSFVQNQSTSSYTWSADQWELSETWQGPNASGTVPFGKRLSMLEWVFEGLTAGTYRVGYQVVVPSTGETIVLHPYRYMRMDDLRAME